MDAVFIKNIRDFTNPEARTLAELYHLNVFQIHHGYRRFNKEVHSRKSMLWIDDPMVRQRLEYFLSITACAVIRTLEALEHPHAKLYFPTSGRIRCSRNQENAESDYIIKVYKRTCGKRSHSNLWFDLLLITEFLFGLDMDFYGPENHSREITRLYTYILEKRKAEDASRPTTSGLSPQRLHLKVLARTINYSSENPAQIFFMSSNI